MASSNDYYAILGVTKDSTSAQIKSAYRKMAIQYHPDKNKTKEGEAKFKEVTKAYEVLSDPQKKQTYDQYGHQAFEQGGMGGPGGGQQGGGYGPFSYGYSTQGTQGFDFGGFSDPFEIFESFFGGASPFGQRARRPVYQLSLSFKEAVNGVEKTVDINGKAQKIKVPKGVDTGTRMRFGEYDIIFEVAEDAYFKREGSDVITVSEISYPTAVLGGQISVKTIEGDIDIRIPAATQPESLIRLRGKGVTRLQSSSRGDHYVRIKLIIPKSVSKQEKDLLQELDKSSSKNSKKSWF